MSFLLMTRDVIQEKWKFYFSLSFRTTCLFNFEIFFQVSIFVPISKVARICHLKCFNVNLLFDLNYRFEFLAKLTFFQCSSKFKEIVIILGQLCLLFLLYFRYAVIAYFNHIQMILLFLSLHLTFHKLRSISV